MKHKIIIVLGLILIALCVLDALTTKIGFMHGLGEANPNAQKILEFSPFLFWIGGMVISTAMAALMIYKHKHDRQFFWIFLPILLFMICIKLQPPIWNIEQILVMRGLIS